MKTAALEGHALDYWFMRATGEGPIDSTITCDEYVGYGGMSDLFGWDVVGTYLERELISVQTIMNIQTGEVTWQAMCPSNWIGSGSTPLIAVMRCVVLAKFGEEVEP